ncbi:CHC2 zinc finger domain-containing protein [Anatilimnocola aggregata]|uniref:CHC2 zinc finger domain-containing protein n=1 Tax=Anatilimnocola aggregata TaxID=2528021 RepID=UPI00192E5914|nr:CHC2 zinc finger domain-containing protein [Anatilimnocola aggregata]
MQYASEHRNGQHLHILYRGLDGSPCRVRVRHGVSGSESRWLVPIKGRDDSGKLLPKKSALQIVPYFLDRLSEAHKAGFLIIVEGETDCWTLKFHGFPSLGIPGANLYKCLEKFVQHIRVPVFVIQEHDKAGEKFAVDVPQFVLQHGHTAGVRTFTLPTKDVSALHCSDPNHVVFKRHLERALVDAKKFVPLTGDALAAWEGRPKRVVASSPNDLYFAPADLQGALSVDNLHSLITHDLGQPHRGDSWCCPFHDDRSPSLSTFVDNRDGRGRFKCHGCGKTGDVFEWLQERRGLDFKAAKAFLGLQIDRPKAQQHTDLQNDVRINSRGIGAPAENSDMAGSSQAASGNLPDFHAGLSKQKCPEPKHGYFVGIASKNANKGLFGLYPCGCSGCSVCHDHYKAGYVSQFVQAAATEPDSVPYLVEHQAKYGGEKFYVADIRKASLPTITKYINRATDRTGIDSAAIQYVAVEHSEDASRATLIATVEFKGSRPITLQQAQRELAKQILAITPEMRANRHRPLTSSQGWKRPKPVCQWKMILTPTRQEWLKIELALQELRQSGVITSLQCYTAKGGFPRTVFDAGKEFDHDEFLYKLGHITGAYIRVLSWNHVEVDDDIVESIASIDIELTEILNN